MLHKGIQLKCKQQKLAYDHLVLKSYYNSTKKWIKLLLRSIIVVR